jgi:hypothetical protein
MVVVLVSRAATPALQLTIRENRQFPGQRKEAR